VLCVLLVSSKCLGGKCLGSKFLHRVNASAPASTWMVRYAISSNKGDIIMFAMGSSSPSRVDPRAGQSLGGQFACVPVYYGVFSTIIDVTNGGCGRNIGDEKRFNIGFNSKLP